MKVTSFMLACLLLVSVGWAQECHTWSLQNYERQSNFQLIANNDDRLGEVKRYAFWSDRYPEEVTGSFKLEDVFSGASTDEPFNSPVWFSSDDVSASKPYLHLVTSRKPQKTISQHQMLPHKIRGGTDFIQLDVSLAEPLVVVRTEEVELCVFAFKEQASH
jgi:hypothetical protein